MDTGTQLSFVGTDEEQKIANLAFEAMKRKGILFAANAPIRMSVESIAQALTKAGGPMAGDNAAKLAPKIEEALVKNDAVFARAENGEFVTTKAGRAHGASAAANTHTFKDRLNTSATTLDADAAKEYAESLVTKAAARADRPVMPDTGVDDNYIPIMPPPMHTPHIIFDNMTVIPQHLIPAPPVVETPKETEEPKVPAKTAEQAAPVAPAASAPAPTVTPAPAHAPAPAAASAPATVAPAAGIAPPATTRPEVTAPAPQPAQAPAARTEAAPAPVHATPAPEPQFTDVAPPAREAPTLEPVPQPAPVPVQAQQPAAQVAAPEPAATAPVAAAPTPAPAKPAPAAPAPAAPVITGPVEAQIDTEAGSVTVDLRDSVDEILLNDEFADALVQMVEAAIAEDTRLVRFGSEIFPEEAIERFSKGDFRRIKDFLDEPETGGVASDTDFMDYVLNRRPEHPDYERLRFSLDYRMLREKKDFEFVGTDTNRLWMTAGAVPVASPKRKPAEIGQDYRYLEDPAISSVEEEGELPEGPLTFSLTMYEYENGVLPYDRLAKSVFAGPVLDDQRSSLLQFEIPQLYTSVLGELRFPTGNRGGFIMGFADFFAEHMVPGAKFRVLPTDRADNIFEIQFTRTPEEERNLLQFDDRKGRYLFRPVSSTVETDPSMLLTQEKFGKLHNQKKLEESERKKPDIILANAFESTGEATDGKYWTILDDLYPVVNLDRPMSRSWLKTLLSGAYPFFYPDENTEGAYFYDPSKRPQ